MALEPVWPAVLLDCAKAGTAASMATVQAACNKRVFAIGISFVSWQHSRTFQGEVGRFAC
jgi:hypothetical protein